jgi:hypothetical protein
MPPLVAEDLPDHNEPGEHNNQEPASPPVRPEEVPREENNARPRRRPPTLEELKDRERKQIKKLGVIFLVVMVVLVAVVVGVVVGMNKENSDNKDDSNNEIIYYSPDGYECFTNIERLRLALRYYRVDPNNSTLAGLYGSPVGAWCTTHMTSMRSLFEGISTFDYDVSGWDVSNVKDMVCGNEKKR